MFEESSCSRIQKNSCRKDEDASNPRSLVPFILPIESFVPFPPSSSFPSIRSLVLEQVVLFSEKEEVVTHSSRLDLVFYSLSLSLSLTASFFSLSLYCSFFALSLSLSLPLQKRRRSVKNLSKSLKFLQVFFRVSINL